MSHPAWCSPERCEAGDDSPGSSRAHRSVVRAHGNGGGTVLLWRQQQPAGVLLVAVTCHGPGVGGPVVLLPADVEGAEFAASATWAVNGKP